MLSNRPITLPDEMLPPRRKPDATPAERRTAAAAHRAAMHDFLRARANTGNDWFSREMAAKRYREKRAATDAAWDRTIREGLPLGRMTGVLRQPKDAVDAEAQTWLHMYGRLDCGFDLSPYSRSLAYKVPPGSEDEAFPLIGWLDAAEKRIPGITARVIEIYFNYDALSRVLTDARVKAEAAARDAKAVS